MKNSMLLMLLFFMIITSCKKELTREEDAQNLSEMFAEIERMSLSVDCENSSEWTFTMYGSKSCGGPLEYIPFSEKIDVVHFLKLIENHRHKQQEFNEKWAVMSDCSYPSEPNGVSCQSGNPILEY